MVCGLALGVLLARPSRRVGVIAAACSVVLGIAGTGMYAAAGRQPQRAAKAEAIPFTVRQFARVSPEARAFYYALLSSGRDTCPVFGTALLYNRTPRTCVSAADAGVSEPLTADSLP